MHWDLQKMKQNKNKKEKEKKEEEMDDTKKKCNILSLSFGVLAVVLA
jgi:hypothetical protein